MRIGNAMDFDRELNWQIFYTTVEGHNAKVTKLCVSKFDPPPSPPAKLIFVFKYL